MTSLRYEKIWSYVEKNEEIKIFFKSQIIYVVRFLNAVISHKMAVPIFFSFTGLGMRIEKQQEPEESLNHEDDKIAKKPYKDDFTH